MFDKDGIENKLYCILKNSKSKTVKTHYNLFVYDS